MLQLYISLSSTALHIKGELEFEIVHTSTMSNKRHGPDLSFPGMAMPDFTSASSLVLTHFAIHVFVLQSQHLPLPFCYQGRSLKT